MSTTPGTTRLLSTPWSSSSPPPGGFHVGNGQRVGRFGPGPLVPRSASPEQPAVFLHFNLVEGSPVARSVEGLTQNGMFLSKWGLMWRCCRGTVDVDEVRLELEAQLASARKLGFRVVGLDSHQHMHGLAPVSSAVLDAARRDDLQVRSLGMFITKTWSGRCKRALFGLACGFSELRSSLRPRRPSNLAGTFLEALHGGQLGAR